MGNGYMRSYGVRNRNSMYNARHYVKNVCIKGNLIIISSSRSNVHVIYYSHVASVDVVDLLCLLIFHISIFFSQTTEPLEAKLGRNVSFFKFNFTASQIMHFDWLKFQKPHV